MFTHFLHNCIYEYEISLGKQFVDAQMEAQSNNPEAKEMGAKLNEIYKIALKRVMKKNMG